MARLNEKTQAVRRDRILNAAEQCFARMGFHQTSMQDICREAGVSAGALYVYFSSKEALISGLIEREMQEFMTRLSNVSTSSDFMEGLRALGEAYTLHETPEKLRLHVEINAEAIRNPAIADIVRKADAFVLQNFERLIIEARDAGRINPTLEPSAIAQALSLVGDGICWQRAINPNFIPGDVLPVIFAMIGSLMKPVEINSQEQRSPKMKKKPLLAIGAVFLALAAFNFETKLAFAETTPQEMSEAPAVSVTTVKCASFVETILVTGSLSARDEVLVAPQIEGLRIQTVDAEEGDRIKAGQLLARLDRSALEAQQQQLQAGLNRADAAIAQAHSKITEATALLKQADAAFERAKSLVKSGSTTKAAYDEREATANTAAAALVTAKNGLVLAQAERTQIEAQIRELQLKLDYTEIKAPVDGIISRRTAKVGAVATSTAEPLFRIVASGQIELDAEVPEMYLPRLSAEMPVRIEIAGLKTRTGRVRLVSSEVDRATRLGRVRIFIGDDPELRVGTFAQGHIDTARRTGLGVPSTAILHNEKGSAVQMVNGERVVTQQVVTGLVSNGQTEILSGLKENDQVVLRSGTLLREGDRIRPIVADNKMSEGK